VNVQNLTAMLKIRNSENEGTHEKCALNFNANSPNLVHVWI